MLFLLNHWIVVTSRRYHSGTFTFAGKKKGNLLLLFLFGYILFDSLLAYVMNSLGGQPIRINAVVPFIYLGAILVYGTKRLMPPVPLLLVLMAGSASMFVGEFISMDEFLQPALRQGSTAVAFLVGYATLKNTRKEKPFIRLMYIVSVAYSLTCVLAILRVAPEIFPLKENLVVLGGDLMSRPSITTDQNFQILYFIPSIALLANVKHIWQGCFLLSIIALEAFVLSELQTRSGFLFLLIGVVFALYLANRRLSGHKRLLVALIFMFIIFLLSVLFWPQIEYGLWKIYLRFTVSDYDTFHGRLHGVQFFFENAFNPSFWFPFNPDFYLISFGNEPHFNPAVVLLKGGILSVLALAILQIAPIVMIAHFAVTKKWVSPLLKLIAVGSVVAFLTSLTAPIATMDQLWLWSGAAVGCIFREKLLIRYLRQKSA